MVHAKALWKYRRPRALLLLLALSASTSACTETADTVTSCGHYQPDAPIFVLTSDLRSASAAAILGTDGCLVEVAAVELGYDPALSASDNGLYVSAREKGVVLELAASGTPLTPALQRTFAAGRAEEGPPNPWSAVADARGQLWIARYDLPSLAQSDSDIGVTATFDLSPEADGDGLAEPSALFMDGDALYVALERLDRQQGWISIPPARFLVIDTVNQASLGAFDLVGENPFGAILPAPFDGKVSGQFTVAVPGDHDTLSPSDGVELLQPEVLTSSLLIDELTLGGSALAARVMGPNEAYAIVEGPVAGYNPTSLLFFDPTSKTIKTLLKTEGFFLAGLAVTDTLIVVGDRTPSAPQLHLFDRKTHVEVGKVPLRLYAPVDLTPLP